MKCKWEKLSVLYHMESTKGSCNIAHDLDSHVSTERGSLKQGEQVAGFVISPLKQQQQQGQQRELYKHTTKTSRSPHTAFDEMEMLCQCQENWDASEEAVYSSPFCKHYPIPAKPIFILGHSSCLIPDPNCPFTVHPSTHTKGFKN